MNTHKSKTESFNHPESGAALVTVLLITFLLGTACIAMLSAAGASARNSTDVLSETKAFYAAESGIQAAVNALRYGGDDGGPVNYKDAVNGFANSGDLRTGVGITTGLTYLNCSGDSRVQISGDCNNSYKIAVRDPDNSMSSLAFRTYNTVPNTGFRRANTSDSFQPTRQFTSSGPGVTTISWVPNTPNPTLLSFDADTPTAATPIGGFKVANAGPGGAVFDSDTEFKVFYELMLPGNPGWVISGTISTAGAVTVLSYTYVVTGSKIDLCGGNCGFLQIPPVANGLAEATTNVNAVIWPKEPTRLLVTATGVGPNRSNKQLEAVLQKSPLDGMNSVSPFSMNGPCSEPGNPSNTAVFQAGTSNTTTYSGASAGGVTAPAFAFNSGCNLTTANAWIAQHLTPNGQNQTPQVSPAPAQFETTQLPEWQRTPQQMDSKVQIYRAQAQYSGTYQNPWPQKITNPGYVEGQTGPITTVTFCEGDCEVDGALGGGILVVTGKLNSLGGFGFKGLILVTGPGGWERKGGGCGAIVGNVVISPYTAANVTSNAFTLPPKYEITGAGCSGVTYASLDDLFEGENSALTNFIRGVAEK